MLKFAVGPIPAALHNKMLHQAAARWIRIHYQHTNNRRRRTTTPAGCLQLLLRRRRRCCRPSPWSAVPERGERGSSEPPPTLVGSVRRGWGGDRRDESRRPTASPQGNSKKLPEFREFLLFEFFRLRLKSLKAPSAVAVFYLFPPRKNNDSKAGPP